jgi:Homeodomain-like domain
VLTVGKDASQVERRLLAGLLACPDCGGRLGPWGHARARVLRGVGESWWRCRPRRAVCAGCGRTHVLLPVNALVRRADVVGVIGSGLALSAAGWGHRRIAERLGRPPGTVRGWVRRLGARAEALRSAFTELLVELDPLVLLPEPAGTVLGDAAAAIVAAAVAAVRRWGVAVSGLSPWELAAAVTSGRLLVLGPHSKLINMSCPW